MIKLLVTRRFLYVSGVVLFAALTVFFLSRSVRAGQGNQQGQQQPAQSDQGQSQGQSQQQEKPKKKGGLFSGFKAVTGSSSAQTTDTASAGAKGIGDGEKIGNVTPTQADKNAVTAMENYSVPKDSLTQFIEDGHLKGKQ